MDDMHKFTPAELKRIKFEDNWVDGLDLDMLRQVLDSYDEYLL